MRNCSFLYPGAPAVCFGSLRQSLLWHSLAVLAVEQAHLSYIYPTSIWSPSTCTCISLTPNHCRLMPAADERSLPGSATAFIALHTAMGVRSVLLFALGCCYLH